jgi:hypothetical protein
MSLFDYTGSFSGSFTGDLTSTNGVISSSAQVNYISLQNKPITISVFQKNSIIANTNFREVTFPEISRSISSSLTFLESSVNTLSGQVQAAISGTVPPGTISGSLQIAALGYLTSASAAAVGFGSGGGSINISGSTLQGGIIDGQFTKIIFDSTTGLHVTASDSNTALISIGSHFRDIIVNGQTTLVATGSDQLELVAGNGIIISTSITDTNANLISKELKFELQSDIISSSNQLTVLNIFTSSIQTQVDNLTQETSSYILVSQTSSMSVLSAVTASYISPTFISASVAAAGFGSGGGTATDITALNIFTSSIQTQVDSLIVKTSSYATTGSNIFNGNQNINGSVTSSKVLTNALKFNTSAGVSVGVGELAWNNSDGTLDLGMKGGNVVQQIGQELFYEVRNETGIEIPNGTAVYANGVSAGSGRITAAPYTADGSIREVRFLGLATENISTGVNGFVTHFGYVRGLDTRGTTASSIAVGDEDWQVGDILYVHPTVAGKLTNVPPKHEISAAIVITRHQSVGVLFVRPTSYGHLDDIHDVSINTSSLATGDVLVYNSSSDVWENSDSVNLALTASYISPTFISASAAAAGFGGINLQQTTDLGSVTTNAITASAFSGSKIVLSDSSITPSPIAGGIFYSSSNFYFGFDN